MKKIFEHLGANGIRTEVQRYRGTGLAGDLNQHSIGNGPGTAAEELNFCLADTKFVNPLVDDVADAFHVVLGRFTTVFWHNTVDEVGSTLKVQSERQAEDAVTATGKPQDIKFGNCEYDHRQDNKYCDEEEASKSIQ